MIIEYGIMNPTNPTLIRSTPISSFFLLIIKSIPIMLMVKKVLITKFLSAKGMRKKNNKKDTIGTKKKSMK